MPVGCNVHISTGFETRREFADKVRLQQTALVMTFLRPGVGKEHVYAVQAARRNHRSHDFDCIVLDDANVLQMFLADLLEQTAHARRMDLYTEEVRLRLSRGDVCGRFPHAESDFEDGRLATREHGFEIEHAGRVRYAECRQQRIQRELLRARDASLTADEAADRALLGSCHRARIAAHRQRLTGVRAGFSC